MIRHNMAIGTGEQPRRPAEDVTVPPDWTSARCRQVDPEIFFPDSRNPDYGPAKSVCRSCPLKDVCLEYAMERETDSNFGRFGVWGGMSPMDRTRLAEQTKGEAA